ncbi:ABC transporter ATP-binding protein [Natronorubrum sp. FCH18a]|uniref:ABC transporter ATP-binding protein n=1 Tax=Natronorubrum sp. FCH18a TaxID=3447018 RepID=UPI003F518DAD
MADALLRTENLTKKFEGLTAVDNISFSLNEDELLAVIGPNGAGKTTFFNLLTGTLAPTDGHIWFNSNEITNASPSEIARKGIIRSYQTTQVFEGLTVLENVRIAVQSNHNPYVFWNDANEDEEMLSKAREALERVGLWEKRDQEAANLSHGEQRTLEIAIALGGDPQLLLLDEPSSGMSPEETADVIDLIGKLSSDDLGIIFIEHKMSVVMEVADRIIVLHQGQVLADGPPEEVRKDEQVQRVYLGGTEA